MSAVNIQSAEYNNKQQELEKLIADIEDETDSSSIDKILAYAEKIQNIDEKFMEKLSENLGDAVVYWEQPWYQQVYALTHKDISLIVEDGEAEFCTDAINQSEHQVIAKNWRKLRKKYRLPDSIISLARWKNTNQSRNPKFSIVEKARRFAAAYLARGLRRTVHRVYQHIMAYYGGQRRGLYNSTERKIIDICFLHLPKSAAMISASVLGRIPRGIYKRLYKLTNGKQKRGKSKKRIKWTLPLATKLVNSLLKHTGLELIELKNKKIEKNIWYKVAEDMDHDDDLLHHFWYCYLHVQLFVKADVKLQELRVLILEKLRKKARENEYQIWSDIRWRDIASEFPDAFTQRFLYRVCTRLISESGTYKGHLSAPIEDVIDYAFQKIQKYRKLERNKRLKTLKLNKEGKLELALYRPSKQILEGNST